jgi:transforming growth factor-beta-induced protein
VFARIPISFTCSQAFGCSSYRFPLYSCFIERHLAPNPKCQSITEIACDSKDFTVLCEALQFTELDDDLDEGSWTVFGPTDDSFYELMDRLELNSIKDLGKEKLTEVLLYHAVSNELKFDDLQCGKHVVMASGEDSLT